MNYIGITGHRGSGKNSTAYLLGNILERMRRGQSKDEIESCYSEWCEEIKLSDTTIYDSCLHYVYFDEFGELPKSMVAQLLGVDMSLFDNDFMKDHMYVNLKDFTLHKDVSENIVTSNEYLNSIQRDKPRLIRRLVTENYMNLREFIKMFSVDIMQGVFGTNVWLKSRIRIKDQYGEVDGGWRIFTDAKRADELLYIMDNGGTIIKVQRQVNRKKDNGISNIEGVDADYTVTITTDIEDMFEDIYNIAKDIYDKTS